MAERNMTDDEIAHVAVLPFNVRIGSHVFYKGQPLSALIEAAKNWHRYACPDWYGLPTKTQLAFLEGLKNYTGDNPHALVLEFLVAAGHVSRVTVDAGLSIAAKLPKRGESPQASLPTDAAGGVDWLGAALELDAQAERVESNTARRAMQAGANALRLMGARPQPAQQVCLRLVAEGYAYTEASDPQAPDDWQTADVVKAFMAGADYAYRQESGGGGPVTRADLHKAIAQVAGTDYWTPNAEQIEGNADA